VTSAHEDGGMTAGWTGDAAHEEPHGRARHQVSIDAATSALATHLGWTSTRALAQLTQLATATDTNLAEVAAVLTGASTDAPELDTPDPTTAFDPSRYLPDPHMRDHDPPVAAPPDPPLDMMGVTVPPEVRAALEATHVAAGYLTPLRDADGRTTDFVMIALSEEARERYEPYGIDMCGRRLTAIWPNVDEIGMLEEYVRVIETGEPMRRGPFHHWFQLGAARWQSLVTCRASRLADGLIVTWHYHPEQDRFNERLKHVQRMVELGWAEWDLVTDTTSWSPGMYRIFGRNPELGPVTLPDLPDTLHPDDLPIALEALRALVDLHESSDLEYRIPRPDGLAHVRMLAEPVPDVRGRTALIRLVAIDMTQRRRDEHALESARAELTRQRQLTAVQRRVGRELRQAILPMKTGTLTEPGLRYAVRYLAAESNARIGGDWYTVNGLPDGRVLIGVGDAAGHGLRATALMARMRSGLAGLSYTGAPAGRLTRWLNELVGNDTPQSTATAVLGHFDPARRELVWSCAGHPQPILVRDGTARRLDGEIGALLGAVDHQRYPQTRTQLHAGDLLLFYTDGLVERRGSDIDDGIDALLDAARHCDGADPTQDLNCVLGSLDLGDSEDDACLLALRVR